MDILQSEYQKLNPDKQPIGIYAVDKNGNFVEVNHVTCELLCSDEYDLLTTSIARFYRDPKERDKLMNKLRRNPSEKLISILNLIIKGEEYFLLDTAHLIFNEDGIEVGTIGFLCDITRQERAYRLLRRVPTGVYIANADGIVLYANEGLNAIFSGDMLGKTVNDVYRDKSSRDVFENELINAINNNIEYIHVVLRLQKLDGTPFVASVEVHPYLGPDGKKPWREGIISDITEKASLEQAFRVQPGSYELQKDNQDKFVIVRCSQNFAELFGYENPIAIYGHCTKEFAVDLKAYDDFEKIVSTGEPVFDTRLQVWNKDKTHKFWISINCVTLKNEKGEITGRLGFVHDISKQIEAVETLERFMYDTGRLLHGYSNALIRIRTAIPSEKQLLEYIFQYSKDSNIKRNLDKAITSLTKELLAFIKRQKVTELKPDILDKLERHVSLLINRKEIIPNPALQPATYRRIAVQIYEEISKLLLLQKDESKLTKLHETCKRVIAYANLYNLTEVIRRCEEMEAQIRLFRRRFMPYPSEQRRPIKIETILNIVLNEWSELASNNDIIVKIKEIPDGKIRCRLHEMTLALGNLFHNAIKYSWVRTYGIHEEKRGAFRFIDINVVVTSQKELVLKIANLGVAITKDEIESGAIYKPGFRGRYSGIGGRLGSGLGISFAKSIIEQYGGRLYIESRPADPNADPQDYNRPFITTVTVKIPVV